MDYILFSAIYHCKVDWRAITISYDIACQYFKNIWKRMHSDNFPASLRLDIANTKVTAVVPKFHLVAHEQRCHTSYSLNLQPGAGCLDGEVIECNWAKLGVAANSMKEMSAGSRRDTLDDLCGDMNYTKLKTMGISRAYSVQSTANALLGPHLGQKLQVARSATTLHTSAFEELSSSIDSALLSEWNEMVDDFHRDNRKTNPYEAQTKSCMFLSSLLTAMIVMYPRPDSSGSSM
jgi:Kyakuja-Dileera-Zisupton transposase